MSVSGRELRLCLKISDGLFSNLEALIKARRSHYAEKATAVKSLAWLRVVLREHQVILVVVLVFPLVNQFCRSRSLHDFLMERFLIVCVVRPDSSLIAHDFLQVVLL